jgi:hypothetical protein
MIHLPCQHQGILFNLGKGGFIVLSFNVFSPSFSHAAMASFQFI